MRARRLMATTGINLAALEEECMQRCRSDAALCERLYNYYPTLFFRMVGEYGLRETGRRLVPNGSIEHPPEGFVTLVYECNSPDLTLEALIHDNPRFHPLFDPVTIENCASRLAAIRYEDWCNNYRRDDSGRVQRRAPHSE